MSYIRGFTHDVFVSYAHADNLPVGDDTEGWIAKFHRSFLAYLRRLIRDESLSVFRDPKLNGNDMFENVLEQSFRGSAVLITVLTPNYIESEWCIRELRGFAEAASSPATASKSRLFKVQPWGLERERHPRELAGMLGYQFYSLDPTTGDEESFRRTSEQDPDQRYWSVLNHLARDVGELLKALKAARDSGEPDAAASVGPPADAPAVYLADVTDDLLDAREQIRRSLAQAGLRVLPESALPAAPTEFAEAVQREVARVSLSVHMLGPYYGRIPAGESRSYSRIQYEAACDASAARSLPLLVWVKKGSEEAAEPLQRDFLQGLERGPEAAAVAGGEEPRVELFQVGIEELKEAIVARVRPPEPGSSDNPFFYISCTADDSEKAQRFLKCLKNSNYEGVVSPAEGDSGLLRKHHRANLKRCDVFVTMYGRAPEVWVSEKVLEAWEVAMRRKKKRMTLSVLASPQGKSLGVALRALRVWEVGDNFGCEDVKRCLREI
jgi:hypothetical protein